MPVSISEFWDCCPKEFVADIAAIIYRTHDAKVDGADMLEKFDSPHPTEQACWAAAEEIFEMLTGDSPDYQSD